MTRMSDCHLPSHGPFFSICCEYALNGMMHPEWTVKQLFISRHMLKTR